MNKTIELKERLIKAGYVAVEELIRIGESKIIQDEKIDEEQDESVDGKTKKKKPSAKIDLSADKMRTAASAKKLAIFDAFEILQRLQVEEVSLNEIKSKSAGESISQMASPESRGTRPR